MSVSAAFAAQACYDLYGYYGPPKTKWDFITPLSAECFYGVTKENDTILVVFRGVSNLADLIRILEVCAEVPEPAGPFNYDGLGPVHPGGWDGLIEALTDICIRYDQSKIQFVGHSMGAMRATLATALFANTYRKSVIKPRICFGETKSGYLPSAMLADVPGSISFLSKHKHLHDPLYAYPFTLWPEKYVHGTKPTLLDVDPDGDHPIELIGPLALHFMGYYLKAFTTKVAPPDAIKFQLPA